MKDIPNVIDLCEARKQRDKVTASQYQTALVINHVFKSLRRCCTAFRLAWPTREAYRESKAIWLEAFLESGVNTIEQVQRGLKKCYLRNSPFVPSPGEFISWCKPMPKELGFPDVYEAFKIANLMNRIHENYIHPHEPTRTVLEHFINDVGATQLRRMSEKNAFRLFENFYSNACQQYISGSIKPMTRAITSKPEEHPSDRVRSNKAKEKSMASIKKMDFYRFHKKD